MEFSGKDCSNTYEKRNFSNKILKKEDEKQASVSARENEHPETEANASHAANANTEPEPVEDITTTQRFAKKIGGIYYLVRVCESGPDGQACVIFSDWKSGRRVAFKRIHRRWLKTLSATVRKSLLTNSGWFRDHADTILGLQPSSTYQSLRTPKRRPPPVPRDFNSMSDTEDAKLKTYKIEIAEKTNEISVLKTELSSLKSQENKSRLKVTELERKLATNEEIIADLKVELESKGKSEDSDKAVESSSAYISLQKKLQKAEEELEKQISQNQDRSISNGDVSKLQAELLETTQKLESKEIEITKLKQNLETTMTECEEICKELQEMSKNEIESRDKKISEESGRNDALQSMVDASKKQVRGLEEEAKMSAKLLSDTKQEYARLETKLALCETSLEKYKKESETKVVELEKSLADMTESKNRNKTYGAQMKKKCLDLQAAAESKVLDFQKKNDHLNKYLKERSSRIEILEKRNKELESTSKQLHSQNSTAVIELESLKSELQLKNQDVKELEIQVKRSEEDLAREKAAKEKLETEQKTKYAGFEAEKQRLENQFKEETNKLKIQNFETSEELKKKVAENTELLAYVSTLLDKRDQNKE